MSKITNNESIKTLVWIWQNGFTPASRKGTMLMLAMNFFSLLLTVLTPLGWTMVVEGAVVTQSTQLILTGLTLWTMFWIGEKVFSGIRSVIRERVWNVNHLQFPMHLTKLFFRKTLGEHHSENSTIDHNNIETIKNKVGEIQNEFIYTVVRCGTIIVIAYALTWYLSYIAGMILTMYVVFNAVWFAYISRYIVTVNKPIDEAFRLLYKRWAERWELLDSVITSGNQDSIRNDMRAEALPVFKVDLELWGKWLPRQQIIRSLLGVVILIAVAWYSTMDAVENSWTAGTLVLMFTLLGRIHDSLTELGDSQRTITEALERITAYRLALVEKPLFCHEAGLEFVPGGDACEIQFNNISLEHTSGVPVLQDISFTIAAGEKVALVGESGSGKSSLVELLLRYRDPTGGSINVCGQNLANYSANSYRQAVGYIPQLPQIFSGTVRENVLMGLSSVAKEALNDEYILRVMKSVRADLGTRYTKGLDTIIGKDGIDLSGGEKQRLVIARALLRQPSLLVVDEATSALDTQTEKEVQKAIEAALGQNVTAFIVAHRIETLEQCDRFVILRPASSCLPGESQIAHIATSYKEFCGYMAA